MLFKLLYLNCKQPLTVTAGSIRKMSQNVSKHEYLQYPERKEKDKYLLQSIFRKTQLFPNLLWSVHSAVESWNSEVNLTFSSVSCEINIYWWWCIQSPERRKILFTQHFYSPVHAAAMVLALKKANCSALPARGKELHWWPLEGGLGI